MGTPQQQRAVQALEEAAVNLDAAAARLREEIKRLEYTGNVKASIGAVVNEALGLAARLDTLAGQGGEPPAP